MGEVAACLPMYRLGLCREHGGEHRLRHAAGGAWLQWPERGYGWESRSDSGVADVIERYEGAARHEALSTPAVP